MLRTSHDQYVALKRSAEGKPLLREPRAAPVKRRASDLPENQVEAVIVGYLRTHGWIVTKQHAGVFYRKKFIQGRETVSAFTIGEKGQADWRAERPIIPPGQRATSKSCYSAELFYFETKAPGKKPEPHQQLWLDRRQLTGLAASWFDSLDSFVGWYRKRYGLRAGDPPLDKAA